MYSFEGLVEEILRNRPEMSREEVLNLIEEKKRTVGAGYLTDQGALYLIAGELGIRLKPVTSDLALKDLSVGVNDITVVARVLAVYPISEYKRKDGGVGKYRRVSLFDGANVVRLTIWDDNQEAMRFEGISEDTPVRISNGYVRQGLDGKPNLNLGRRGRVEVLGEGGLVAKISPLAELTKTLDEVRSEDSVVLALKAVTSSRSRSSNFVREDGTQGSLTQFDVSSETTNGVRVVIWNPREIPEIDSGQDVVVTNLRVKKGNTGLREFHGDTGSKVRVGGRGVVDARLTKVNQIGNSPGRVNVEVMVLSKREAEEVLLKDGNKASRIEVVLGDDTGEITMVGWGGCADRLMELDIGQKVRIVGASRQASRMGAPLLQLETDSGLEKVSA